MPILIDETDLIGPFKAIVAAVPFRQRAILIYFKVYTNAEISKMKYPSHNVLVQKFCWRVNKIATGCLPKRSQPVLIFDPGFARGQYLMPLYMRRKIQFVIRVCKNTGLEFEGCVTTLNQLSRTGFYPQVVYHRQLKLRLNLYVARDESFEDSMYLVTNCGAGLKIYLCYKLRMQIEHGFGDLKTTFGFRHLRLKRETNRIVVAAALYQLWVVNASLRKIRVSMVKVLLLQTYCQITDMGHQRSAEHTVA